MDSLVVDQKGILFRLIVFSTASAHDMPSREERVPGAGIQYLEAWSIISMWHELTFSRHQAVG
jgi:hypothetical protein